MCTARACQAIQGGPALPWPAASRPEFPTCPRFRGIVGSRYRFRPYCGRKIYPGKASLRPGTLRGAPAPRLFQSAHAPALADKQGPTWMLSFLDLPFNYLFLLFLHISLPDISTPSAPIRGRRGHRQRGLWRSIQAPAAAQHYLGKFTVFEWRNGTLTTILSQYIQQSARQRSAVV